MLKDDMEGLQWAVEAMVLARRQLLPALQNGNQGCGGRLRCSNLPWQNEWLAKHSTVIFHLCHVKCRD